MLRRLGAVLMVVGLLVWWPLLLVGAALWFYGHTPYDTARKPRI